MTYRDDLPKVLLHYTSIEGVVGILNDQAIRLTAHYTTNDTSELTASAEHVRTWLEEERESCQPGTERFFEMMLSAMQSMDTPVCFVSSLSGAAMFSDEASNGRLSQWRGYANGGYALVFKTPELQRFVRQFKGNFSLEKVSYTDRLETLKQNLYVRLLGGETTNPVENVEWEAVFDRMQEIIDDERDDATPLFDRIRSAMTWHLVHQKNKHFREENEFRLSTSIAGPFSIVRGTRQIEAYSRTGLAVPYVRLGRQAPEVPHGKGDLELVDCLEKIIVAPSADQEMRVRALRTVLTSKQMDEKAVCPSKIPFRQ